MQDTTSASLAWSLLLIALHPAVQARLHDEIDRVLGRTPTALTLDDLRPLEYLECVIKESLRLRPSVPSISRELTEDVALGPYQFRKCVEPTLGPSRAPTPAHASAGRRLGFRPRERAQGPDRGHRHLAAAPERQILARAGHVQPGPVVRRCARWHVARLDRGGLTPPAVRACASSPPG